MNCTMAMVAVEAIIFVFLFTSKDSENCQTRVISTQAAIFLNIMLGMCAFSPTNSWFAIFTHESDVKGGVVVNSTGEFIRRTNWLRLCEVVALAMAGYELIAIIGLFVFITTNGSILRCPIHQRFDNNLLTILILLRFVLIPYQLLLFIRFREHQKMKFGLFSAGLPHKNKGPDAVEYSTSQLDDADMTKKEFRRALYQAVHDNDVERVNALLQTTTTSCLKQMYGTKRFWFGLFSRSSQNPLHVACVNGNVAVAEILLQAGIPPDEMDNLGAYGVSIGTIFEFIARTLLMSQSSKSLSTETVKSDNEATATTFKNIFGMVQVSPLHAAVGYGHVEVVDLLIKYGADVNLLARSSFLTRGKRLPPLFMADSVKMARCLLHHRANLLLVPSDSNVVGSGAASSAMTMTVLEYAATESRGALYSIYETWGGDVALTPLHTSAAAGNIAVVKHYIKGGVLIDSLGSYYDGKYQRTPLHWAAIMGQAEVIRLLLDAGANPHAVDKIGRTPLHWSVRSNSVESVKELLDAGSNPQLIDELGYNVICIATEDNLGNEGILRLLVERGTEIDSPSFPGGDTALHLAMQNHTEHAALTLLRCGANLSSLNAVGRKPTEYTVSAELQFKVKKEAKANDVWISYSKPYRKFAEKLRDEIEASFITTFMIDPDQECDNDLKLTALDAVSVMVSVLSKDYEQNEQCMNELANAKHLDIPILGVFCDRTELSEELQVYLYTRQILSFSNALRSVNYKNQNLVEFQYHKDKFNDGLRCLLDGLRDEIELRRLDTTGQPRRLTTESTELTAKDRFNQSISFDRNMPSIFLSHGDCHSEFVGKLYRNLSRNGVKVIVDSSYKTTSLNQRIIQAKDAILGCSVFMVVLSPETLKTALLSDQLAYAEDKNKPIIPIVYSDHECSIDENDSSIVFSNDLGFKQSIKDLEECIRLKSNGF